MYYKYHKINLICGRSYRDSPNWKNPINKNKCFQCGATLALNHKKTGKYSGRIKKVKPLIDKCTCKCDWKKQCFVWFVWLVPNGEAWYYIVVKNLSTLLRGTTS